jgi:peptide/nickel transport system substrate-binding protein
MARHPWVVASAGVLMIAVTGAAPALARKAGGVLQPQVKGLTLMVNSLFNGWRFEDVWLDR